VAPEEIPLRYRATILYLFAAVLLAGIYLYEIRQDWKKEKAQDTAKVLFRIRADELTSLTLRRGDLAQFGLDYPSLIITYNTDGDTGTLSIGAQSPIEYGFYATTHNERRVYLISTEDKETLDKGLSELRDKMLFTLKPEKVERFMIEREAARWALIKKKGAWLCEDDKGFRVAQKRVNSLVERFAWAQAFSFEKETVDSLEPFGLHRPKARITLSDGERTQVILLGSTLTQHDTKIYAKMERRPQVVAVGKWLLDGLPHKKTAIKEEEMNTGEEKPK
jgi:hypothetical protein